jgi:hypothetical protein
MFAVVAAGSDRTRIPVAAFVASIVKEIPGTIAVDVRRFADHDAPNVVRSTALTVPLLAVFWIVTVQFSGSP